jgi:hypothetical protein
LRRFGFRLTGRRIAWDVAAESDVKKETCPMIRLVSFRDCAVIFACIALLPLLGCGEDDGIGQRYSVSGKVTYKGEPLKGGNVAFLPDGEGGSGRAASGVIKDGYYSMTTSTSTPGDGVLPGKYKVGINANYTDMSEAAKQPGGIYQGNRLAGPRIKVIPEKYTNPATSGLTFEVKPTSSTFDIDLQEVSDAEDAAEVSKLTTKTKRKQVLRGGH